MEARNVPRVEIQQDVQEDVREPNAEDSRSHPNQQRFRKQLTDDSPTACAQRNPHASSRILLAALANSRLAAFPQAISSTSNTAPSSSHIRGRTGPTALSMKPLTN